MLNLYQASAGSGKTFSLALEYFKLILKNPESFRHTLAVTFTNKATEEMKRRILDELFVLSVNPEGSPYLEELMKEKENLGIRSQRDVQEKSRELLSLILHDYGHLSVSTIDQFFQRLIRSFLRELKQSPSYTIELDEENLLSKAVDNVLHKIDGDVELKKWVEKSISYNIEEGGTWSVDKSLLELGKELFNEKMSELETELFSYSFDALDKLQKKLQNLIKEYRKELKVSARKVLEAIENNSLTEKDIKGGARGPVSFFKKIAEGESVPLAIEELNKTVQTLRESQENWIAPKKLSEPERIRICGELSDAAEQVFSLISEKGRSCATALVSIENLYQLGGMKAVSEELLKCCQEDDVMLIHDTMMLLKNLIAGNDSTFIYEKFGVVFDNIMIDEFQDTSTLQWKNFYPLMLNTVSSGNYGMIVGDIKQSIYKFRNGDWTLLANKVKEDFFRYGDDVKEHVSQYNWRSAANIVNFNNVFFTRAIAVMKDGFCKLVGDGLKEHWQEVISDTYKNCGQEPKKKQAAGCVEILYSENSRKKKEIEDGVFLNVMQVLDNLFKKKVPYSDCTILVSTGKEGSAVARLLLDNNIPFVSNDSLRVDSSVVVRFIITVFKYFVSPGDLPNKAALASFYYRELLKEEPEDLLGRCTKEADLKDLTGIDIDEKELFSKSLFDIVEQLIAVFDLGKNREELPYLLKLQNEVYQYCTSHPDSIADFLEEWELSISSSKLSLSENINAVKIMTIHKSKGLEFKHVIIPFFNWSFYKNGTVLWVDRGEKCGNIRHIPVVFNRTMQKSDFAAEYADELYMSMIDRLNLLYVAMTRASLSMHICAVKPPEKSESFTSAILLDKLLHGNISLVEWTEEKEGYYRYGEIEKVDDVEGTDGNVLELDRYAAGDASGRFKIRSSRKDFSETDMEKRSAAIDEGKLLHFIMQNVKHANDVPRAVAIAGEKGLVVRKDVKAYVERIVSFIGSAPEPEWFSQDVSVLTERTIVLPGGEQFRPDRVVETENDVIVIDYKFGEFRKQYNVQVQMYCNLLQRMGYKKNIRGVVWYPLQKRIVEVKPALEPELYLL